MIQRSLGDPKGYETRNHALAWARAIGSDKAMVVLGSDKRWHAVETNNVGQSASGGTGKVASAILVGKIDPATYESLKNAAMEKNDPEKWKTFAAYALGVPRDEINVVRQGDTPSNKHVNINLTRDFDAEGKTAGFDPAKPPWVQLGPKAFDRPANACADAGARTRCGTAEHDDDRAERLPSSRLIGEAPHGQESLRLGRQEVKTAQDVRNAEIVAA